MREICQSGSRRQDGTTTASQFLIHLDQRSFSQDAGLDSRWYHPPTMTDWSHFTQELRLAIANATELASQKGCDQVSVEQLLIAVCSNPISAAGFVLEKLGMNRIDLIAQLTSVVATGTSARSENLRLSPAALHLLDVAVAEAHRLNHRRIGSEHLILAIQRIESAKTVELLKTPPLDAGKIISAIQQWHENALLTWKPRRSLMERLSDKVPGRVHSVAKLPVMAWKVFVGKSLGHPGFVSNPYPLYRWLRKRDPIRRDPLAPVWVVTRYADVAVLLKDPRFNKSSQAANRLPAVVREQFGMEDETEPVGNTEGVSMLFLDPPRHTRVRSFFSRAFTPRMISGLRPRIQLIADKRIERVLPARRMDLIETIAYPLPVIVIAELLGFPPEDYPKFKKWSDDFAASLSINPTAEQYAGAGQSRIELREYFDRLLPQLEANPGDNLLSALLAMEHEEGALTREELFTNCVLLLAAGNETTTNLISNGILQLLKNPVSTGAAPAKSFAD